MVLLQLCRAPQILYCLPLSSKCTPWHPPAAHSVAKDDVVISTKEWACIPLPGDIICAFLRRQPEKGESDGSGRVGNSSFWHRINSALLIAPICCWARRLPEWLYSRSLDTQLVSHTHSLCELSAAGTRSSRPRSGKMQMSWPTSADRSWPCFKENLPLTLSLR